MISLAPSTTPFLFFTGKGGVGKTSVACAIAVQLADAGRRTLVVSTDPASNLDDVFAIAAGTSPTPVPGVDRLAIMNLDPEAAAAAYRERMVGPFRGVLPAAAIRSMEEQLSGACTVEIAAFNEFTALLASDDTRRAFDHVVFDTAPTGHTLRLLTLPSAWNDFIATNTTGTSCLGPLAGLERHKAQYAEAVAALSDAARTTLVLVTRPEASALREAARASDELRAVGLANQALVVNGVLTDGAGDPVGAAYAERHRRALALLPAPLDALPRRNVPLVSWELTGLEALRAFGALLDPPGAHPPHDDVAAGGSPAPVALPLLPGLEALVDTLAASGHGVVMTMGKGGVGKTSLATALAIALAARGHRVHLTTTDPAAHVEQALAEQERGARSTTLSVSRIDPARETLAYAREVMDAAGDLDAAGRALLEEDLRSPCTEEIAVFRAFARVVDEGAGGFVVLDTAPTGHTLLLLDAAESYHREVARTAGAAHIPDAVRALLPRLRDPDYTRMLLVTLAETTPIREAGRLQAELRRAGIEPFGWVVNASLAASGTRHPLLSRRAALEVPLVEALARDTTRLWLVPWRA